MRAGEPEFEEAVEATIKILREVAGQSRDEADALVTYKQLSKLLATKGLRVHYHGGPMRHILSEASLREHTEGRAMISALVGRQGADGKARGPSTGFFQLARRPPFGRQGDDDEIWRKEIRQARAENAAPSTTEHRGRNKKQLVTRENLGAWMVKCNPDVWDLAGFVESGGELIDRWSVVPSYRTALMAEGQRILFWVTGRDGIYPAPGLWGAGTVLGPVDRADGIEGEQPGFWLDEDHRRQTDHFVPVDIQLFDEPVVRGALKADPRLAGLEVFRQPQMGNPLVVTKDELAVIDELVPSQPEKVTVTASGAGFGNPATNAVVEQAAMATVRKHYEGAGWRVEDVSSECCGWDLTCTSPAGRVDRIEVKGVSGSSPVILLTRNEERSAREDEGWRLAVVTKALAAPELRIFDADAACRACAPLVFQVDLRRMSPAVGASREAAPIRSARQA